MRPTKATTKRACNLTIGQAILLWNWHHQTPAPWCACLLALGPTGSEHQPCHRPKLAMPWIPQPLLQQLATRLAHPVGQEQRLKARRTTPPRLPPWQCIGPSRNGPWLSPVSNFFGPEMSYQIALEFTMDIDHPESIHVCIYPPPSSSLPFQRLSKYRDLTIVSQKMLGGPCILLCWKPTPLASLKTMDLANVLWKSKQKHIEMKIDKPIWTSLMEGPVKTSSGNRPLGYHVKLPPNKGKLKNLKDAFWILGQCCWHIWVIPRIQNCQQRHDVLKKWNLPHSKETYIRLDNRSSS